MACGPRLVPKQCRPSWPTAGHPITPLHARLVVGRLPPHVKEYYQTGDTRDRQLWHEYARVTRGLAAVRWSRGLREVLFGADGERDVNDQDLAAEYVGGSVIAAFQPETWSLVRTARLDHAVLVTAEDGGMAVVSAYLRQAAIVRGISSGQSTACVKLRR